MNKHFVNSKKEVDDYTTPIKETCNVVSKYPASYPSLMIDFIETDSSCKKDWLIIDFITIPELTNLMLTVNFKINKTL